MSLTRVPVVAGWQLQAFYLTPRSKYTDRQALFLHPRFAGGIHETTGPAPWTDLQIVDLCQEALMWLTQDEVNANGLPTFGPEDIRIKNYDPSRVVIELMFVVHAGSADIHIDPHHNREAAARVWIKDGKVE